MSESDSIVRMIETGGVYYNISGATPADVFASVIPELVLPACVSRESLLAGLIEREGLMTTSIGNGIALPHPRTPLVHAEEDERIFICFLDKPVNFDAMDGKPVYVLFMILSSGSGSHLRALSRLSFLFQKDSFRALLKQKPDTSELIHAIKELL
ncbi:PTS sugar transporter subunit IIA [Treponema zuelzerae]|uniref:PTS sugar transporter subunit IIA n=1 Tax=Teretinema zuelzerae TaxID=156 RepID=A0AAE3EGS6_9SPIR|nr:PTS sugar transporter subunit IIA [Teretinema zuelzerae]MCD1654217.1 PTS sugar transporter subunit IIA [Teretinema zuelzerae]